MNKTETNISNTVSYKANYWLYITVLSGVILAVSLLINPLLTASESKHIFSYLALYVAFHVTFIILFNHSIYLKKDTITIQNPILRSEDSFLYSQIEKIRLSPEKAKTKYRGGIILNIISSLFWFHEPKSIYLYLHNGKIVKKGCWSFEYSNSNAARMDSLLHSLSEIHSDVKWTKNEDYYYQPSED